MTIRDIARESGYGVTTVSRVLNGQPNVSKEAREKIMEVVRRTDFHLNSNAKRLKQQAGTGIAVVVKGSKNMLFSAILERLQSLLAETGYVFMINYVDEGADEVMEAHRICGELRPKGIMFLGGNHENFKRGFEGIGVPCVLITSSAKELGFPNLSSVTTDDAFAAECAIDHLVSLGHRNIGVLGGYVENSYPAARRYAGCVRAFERYSIPADRSRVVASKFSLTDGYAAMERLLDKYPDITAVFAMADVTAIGAIRAIRDRGLRVPEDISVVGFDGIELGSYLTPKLTTVRQDGEAIAERSVRLLLDAIGGEGGAAHEVVPFRLFDGESAMRLEA